MAYHIMANAQAGKIEQKEISIAGMSIKYLMRIIQVLFNHPKIGISDLALLSRMNHQRCVAIVRWLAQLGYVRISVENNRKEVIVTESGSDFIRKFVSLLMAVDKTVDPTPLVCTKDSNVVGTAAD